MLLNVRWFLETRYGTRLGSFYPFLGTQPCLTLFSTGGGGVYLPPWRILRFSIGKRYQRGVKAVCKLKFSKLWPYQTEFRSKKFFWAEPRAFKVEWVANFWISKSWIFYFHLKNFPQIKDSIPSFLTQHLERPVNVHMQKKWGKICFLGRAMVLQSWVGSKFLNLKILILL